MADDEMKKIVEKEFLLHYRGMPLPLEMLNPAFSDKIKDTATAVWRELGIDMVRKFEFHIF